MKKRNNHLDEMQEKKMLQIEHNSFWMCFWGLFAAIYIQIALGNGDIRCIGGEAVVLTVVALYLLVDCIRNGIWDRKLQPNRKTNMVLSLVTGLAIGGFWFVLSYHRYHKLIGSLATFVIVAVSMGALVMLCLSLTEAIYRKRKKQLDEQADREEEEL